MGGSGPHPKYPKVWTPTGGWYVDPPNWKRNTGIAFVALFACVTYTFILSARLETRHKAPKHWMPSMLWSKVPTKDEE